MRTCGGGRLRGLEALPGPPELKNSSIPRCFPHGLLLGGGAPCCAMRPVVVARTGAFPNLHRYRVRCSSCSRDFLPGSVVRGRWTVVGQMLQLFTGSPSGRAGGWSRSDAPAVHGVSFLASVVVDRRSSMGDCGSDAPAVHGVSFLVVGPRGRRSWCAFWWAFVRWTVGVSDAPAVHRSSSRSGRSARASARVRARTCWFYWCSCGRDY
jgi:hypothetical protein